MSSIVAYYRVSTVGQGASGLGLEAQVDAVSHYAVGVGATIVQSFTEVESGKNAERPQLALALKAARRGKATLCVAKLDRLSRNVTFLAQLMDSGVEFVACDNPHANRFTLHILAAVAEHEARAISERTKAALRAYKARGGVLGGQRPNSTAPSPEAAQRGREMASLAKRRKAVEEYAVESRLASVWRSEGASLQGVADRLNSEGYQTVGGASWNRTTVKRMLDRLEGVSGNPVR